MTFIIIYCRLDFESHECVSSCEVFYLGSLGFWFSCIFFLVLETIRKDFYQLAIHHVLTVSLITISFKYNFYRFGQVVLLTHDIADIFLYSAKASSYIGFKTASNALFTVFAITFFLSRLVIFPLFCICPAVTAGHLFIVGKWKVNHDFRPALVLPPMLVGLQALHIFWWFLIWRMIRKGIKEKRVDKDVRSDEEADEKKTR